MRFPEVGENVEVGEFWTTLRRLLISRAVRRYPFDKSYARNFAVCLQVLHTFSSRFCALTISSTVS